MGRNFWENGYVHWGMNIDGSHGFQHSYFPSVFCPSVYIRIHLLDLSHFLWYCLKLLIGILVLKISCFGVIFAFVFICFFEGGYKLDAIIWMKWDEIFLIFTILFGIVLIGALVSKIICLGVHFFFVKNISSSLVCLVVTQKFSHIWLHWIFQWYDMKTIFIIIFFIKKNK